MRRTCVALCASTFTPALTTGDALAATPPSGQQATAWLPGQALAPGGAACS